MGLRLGGLLKIGDVIALTGDLGAGKTTFVQGLASGWGSTDAVTSPTFVLVNLYRRPYGPERVKSGVIYHLDAYRFSGTVDEILAQVIDLDLDMMLATGVLVVEWAERVQAALPDEYLMLSIHWVDENQRDLTFSAKGKRYERLLTILQKQVYGIS